MNSIKRLVLTYRWHISGLFLAASILFVSLFLGKKSAKTATESLLNSSIDKRAKMIEDLVEIKRSEILTSKGDAGVLEAELRRLDNVKVETIGKSREKSLRELSKAFDSLNP